MYLLNTQTSRVLYSYKQLIFANARLGFLKYEINRILRKI